MRALLLGASVALLAVTAAHAQPSAEGAKPASPPPAATPPATTPPAVTPPSATTSAGSDAAATASAFKPGMIVKDSAGATLGPVERVGRAADGSAAVAITMDGKTVGLPASILTVGPGGEAVSSMTKAQIQAASAKPAT